MSQFEMSRYPNADTHPPRQRRPPPSAETPPAEAPLKVIHASLGWMTQNRSVPGAMLCQPNGVLVGLNEAAQKIVSYARSNGNSDPILWDSLSVRLRRLVSQSRERRVDKPPSLMFELGRRWYLARPLLLRMTDGRKSFSVILLERVSPNRLHRLRVTCEAHGLTPREIEVVKAVIAGYPDKEIGERLGLSYHSVRQYLKTVRLRLGVHSRASLLSFLHS